MKLTKEKKIYIYIYIERDDNIAAINLKISNLNTQIAMSLLWISLYKLMYMY